MCLREGKYCLLEAPSGGGIYLSQVTGWGLEPVLHCVTGMEPLNTEPLDTELVAANSDRQKGYTLHFLTLVSCPDTKWRDYLPPKEGEEPQWASLYSTLVPRPAGDISWRLLHGAVSTGMHLARFTPTPEACPFCGMRENLAHAYLECARLQPLFRLLQNLLLRFWLLFSHTCSSLRSLSVAP
ncbi:unnamed protein product [Caretta caretta]